MARKMLANCNGVIRDTVVEICGLAEIRKSKGFKSAMKFAYVLGIPYATYSAIEAGRFIPNYQRQERIAAALGLGVEDVFQSSIHSPKPSSMKVIKQDKALIELELLSKYGDKLQPVTKKRPRQRQLNEVNKKIFSM